MRTPSAKYTYVSLTATPRRPSRLLANDCLGFPPAGHFQAGFRRISSTHRHWKGARDRSTRRWWAGAGRSPGPCRLEHFHRRSCDILPMAARCVRADVCQRRARVDVTGCTRVASALADHDRPRFTQFCENHANLPGSTATVAVLETCAQAYKADCLTSCQLPNAGTLTAGAPDRAPRPGGRRCRQAPGADRRLSAERYDRNIQERSDATGRADSLLGFCGVGRPAILRRSRR
jgi:hypothetical protein